MVGANFDAYSNETKMMLAGVFTFVFYGLGLWLYQKPKLKPAGVTFTSIGMVSIPLMGVAYANLYSGEHTAIIWFVVSLLSLGAYTVTATIIKHWAVVYAMILALISSINTGLLSFDLPLQTLSWASLTIAGILLARSKFKGENVDVSQNPLAVSAMILAPISLIFSIVNGINTEDLFGLGLNALLGGIFYLELAYLHKQIDNSKLFLGLATILIYAAPILWLFEAGVGTKIISGVSIVLVAMMIFLATIRESEWVFARRDVLSSISIVATIFSLFVWPESGNLWMPFFILSSLYFIGFLLSRRLDMLSMFLIGLLSLPHLVIFNALQNISHRESYILAIATYLIIGALIAAVKIAALRLTTSSKNISMTLPDILFSFYLLAFGLGIIYALILSQEATLTVTFILTGVTIVLSYLEKNPSLQIATQVLIFMTLFNIPDVFSLDSINWLLLSTIYGLAAYLLGVIWKDEPELSKIWRYGGILGLVIGVFSPTEFFGITSLALLAAATYSESKTYNRIELRYLAFVIGTFCIHWAMSLGGIKEVHAFGLLWGALFALLAYSEGQRFKLDNAQLLTVLALSAITIPIGLQTLSGGETWRGLLLVVQSLALVGFGMSISNKLVWQWGGAVLVLEVLYQTRDTFAAIPKQFISLLLGVAILGIAIYFLQKRDD